MQPVVISSPEHLTSDQLDDWGLVKGALSTPVASVRGLTPLALPGGTSVGVWECTPGRWRRQIMLAEFAHFVAGHCWFHPDGGKPFEIKAGDSVFFAANTTGTWEITHTLRKSYVVISPPPLRAQLLAALQRPLGAVTRAAARLLASVLPPPRRAVPARRQQNPLT